MIISKKIEFHHDYRFLKNGDAVVIGNIQKGLWIKCPDYVHKYLTNCVENSYTFEQTLNDCQDSDTLDYMNKLLKTLMDIEVILIEDDVTQKDNIIDDITIELTTGCNLKCMHCGANFGEIEREDLSFESIKKIIHWCEENNKGKIALTGGEIFVRNDIWDILKYIKTNYSGKVEVLTNGTLINKEMISELTNLVDFISISLDGYDEKSVSLIRGEGVYQKVLDTISLLHSNNFRNISLSMVLTKITLEHKKDFEELCSSLDVKPLMRILTPEGRADRNTEMLYPQRKDSTMLEISLENIDIHKNNANFKCMCNLRNKIFICTDEKIYPCFLVRNPMYYIGTISDLLSDSLNTIHFEPIVDKIDKCKQCNVKYFCSSSCPGHESAIRYDEKNLNQICDYMYNYYNKVVWDL